MTFRCADQVEMDANKQVDAELQPPDSKTNEGMNEKSEQVNTKIYLKKNEWM